MPSPTELESGGADVYSVWLRNDTTLKIQPAGRADIDFALSLAEQRRQRVRINFDNDTSGMNIERVSKFLNDHSMAIRPYVVIDSSLRQELGATIRRDIGPNINGSYMPVADLAYVLRDRAMEDKNGGPEITEANLIHELVHANNEIGSSRYVLHGKGESKVVEAARIGMAVQGKGNQFVGSYFEEGIAETLSNRYLRLAAGLPEGLIQQEKIEVVELGSEKHQQPGWYLYRGHGRGFNLSVPSHAAYGIELMGAKDPEIVDAMLDARKDTESLRAVVRKIDDLSPGLYRELRRKQYSSEDFILGTRNIIDALYDGDDGLAMDTVRESLVDA